MHDPQHDIAFWHLLGTIVYVALIGALLSLCLILSGCMDVAQWQARTFYGVDCREEKLVQGHCVPVKKGSADVQTAHP
jgi:hypothetical protein